MRLIALIYIGLFVYTSVHLVLSGKSENRRLTRLQRQPMTTKETFDGAIKPFGSGTEVVRQKRVVDPLTITGVVLAVVSISIAIGQVGYEIYKGETNPGSPETEKKANERHLELISALDELERLIRKVINEIGVATQDIKETVVQQKKDLSNEIKAGLRELNLNFLHTFEEKVDEILVGVKMELFKAQYSARRTELKDLITQYDIYRNSPNQDSFLLLEIECKKHLNLMLQFVYTHIYQTDVLRTILTALKGNYADYIALVMNLVSDATTSAALEQVCSGIILKKNQSEALNDRAKDSAKKLADVLHRIASEDNEARKSREKALLLKAISGNASIGECQLLGRYPLMPIDSDYHICVLGPQTDNSHPGGCSTVYYYHVVLGDRKEVQSVLPKWNESCLYSFKSDKITGTRPENEFFYLVKSKVREVVVKVKSRVAWDDAFESGFSFSFGSESAMKIYQYNSMQMYDARKNQMQLLSLNNKTATNQFAWCNFWPHWNNVLHEALHTKQH